MTKDEILKQSTPRPWKRTKYAHAAVSGRTVAAGIEMVIANCGGWQTTEADVSGEHEANAELVKLAVNSYDADQALIKQLVYALEQSAARLRDIASDDKIQSHCTRDLVEIALAAAKERQP